MSNHSHRLVLFVFLGVVNLTHARAIDDAAIADSNNTSDWLAYGRTHNEQRFSPLDQVNTANVQRLKVDWILDVPEAVGLVSTPLVADGVLYFVGSKNIVRAVDARAGKLLWTFDPEIAKQAPNRQRLAFLHGSRGMAMWKDKVFFASVDGRLIALNKNSGKLVWSVATIDADGAMFITGAPKAFRGKVLIGNGGAENGPSRGYVTAYDAETGAQSWRFYTVPGNPADGFENAAMEMAAKTWTGEWWNYGGGGNVWHGITYDPDYNAIYIGTGNGAPWNQKIRSPGGGDNLFLCSIVALDADTGEYRWHYQTTPGETWDYNSSMDMVLAELRIGTRDVKALLHAPKNGFFYVIDRANGKLVSAEPFAEVSWASHIDLESGRPVELPDARYPQGPVTVTPGGMGAHNWPPMSFNPELGLVYIPTIHQAYQYDDRKVDLDSWEPPDWWAPVPGEGQGVAAAIVNPTSGKRATLQAWDPVKQTRVWAVPLNFTWSPGTLTTAGNLVFQGTAEGDFYAYDARNGDVLWRQPMGLGISAPPITYSLDGRQYIALLVGFGSLPSTGSQDSADLGWAYGLHPRRLITFSLEGKLSMPPSPPPYVPQPLRAPKFNVQKELIAEGAGLFMHCLFCHGPQAISGGATPDLRASGIVLNFDSFANVVRGGALKHNGMPMYRNLTDDQLKALQHYIRWEAETALSRRQK